jgi:archaellum component FlaC
MSSEKTQQVAETLTAFTVALADLIEQRLSEKFAALEDKLDKLEYSAIEQSDLQSKVEDLELKIEDLESTVSDLESTVSDLKDQTDETLRQDLKSALENLLGAL